MGLSANIKAHRHIHGNRIEVFFYCLYITVSLSIRRNISLLHSVIDKIGSDEFARIYIIPAFFQYMRSKNRLLIIGPLRCFVINPLAHRLLSQLVTGKIHEFKLAGIAHRAETDG